MEVPVYYQRLVVAGADAAVIGGQEVGSAVFGGVVQHAAGAEGAATGGNDADGVDFAAPVIAIGTNHIHVAGTGFIE